MNYQELLTEIDRLHHASSTPSRMLLDLIRTLVVEQHDQDQRIEHLERHLRPEVKG